jgi:hypothetical protein
MSKKKESKWEKLLRENRTSVIEPFDNQIEARIAFDENRNSATYGCPYFFTKRHMEVERNKFLYKLSHDLGSDCVDVASQSQSSYSTLSYRSTFDEYYSPMPPSFEDVNGSNNVAAKDGPPKGYQFVFNHRPFEERLQNIRKSADVLRHANTRLLPGERKLAQSIKASKKLA